MTASAAEEPLRDLHRAATQPCPAPGSRVNALEDRKPVVKRTVTEPGEAR